MQIKLEVQVRKTCLPPPKHERTVFLPFSILHHIAPRFTPMRNFSVEKDVDSCNKRCGFVPFATSVLEVAVSWFGPMISETSLLIFA
jgi:hypothetical protein